MKKKVLVSFCIIASILISNVGLAHSGRTDKYGGHYNRKTGEYHFHTYKANVSKPAVKASTYKASIKTYKK